MQLCRKLKCTVHWTLLFHLISHLLKSSKKWPRYRGKRYKTPKSKKLHVLELPLCFSYSDINIGKQSISHTLKKKHIKMQILIWRFAPFGLWYLDHFLSDLKKLDIIAILRDVKGRGKTLLFILFVIHLCNDPCCHRI